MVEDADASNDFLNKFDSLLKATSQNIGWVTDKSSAFGNSLLSSNSNDFAVFKENLLNISIKHECSTVDCTNTRESLRNSS